MSSQRGLGFNVVVETLVVVIVDPEVVLVVLVVDVTDVVFVVVVDTLGVVDVDKTE
jgi:hypothetical protein